VTAVGEGFLADPYPTYRAWRETTPVFWHPTLAGGAWVVTRHADVERVLRDPAFSARRTGAWVREALPEVERRQPFQAIFARALLFLDAPDHDRIRPVLQEAFRPAALQALAPVIDREVNRLLDAVESAPTFDFMASVARPLPARVIATMLGLEGVPEAQLTAWCEDLATFIGAPQATAGEAERARSALGQIVQTLQPALQDRHVNPRDDLLSRLVQARRDGRIHDGPELMAQCAMLFFAGYETTRNLLGNGVRALLQHGAPWQRLVAQPTLLPTAVRELLRYDSPVQYSARRVALDTELHGQRLRRGEPVLAMIGAANRDPAVFERPDEFDIGRAGRAPLSFGAGPHVCLGAALTAMEAQAVLRALARRWPRLALCEGPPAWNRNPVYRGLRSLPVRTGPSASSSRFTESSACTATS
jgi:cytochrome P450